MASLAVAQRETERKIAEQRLQIDQMLAEERRKTEEERQKTEEERQKTEAERRETERVLRELGVQIGGLGNKFGTFTEGLALPSVQHLLSERFGVEDFMPYHRRCFEGEMIELDALGLVNGSRNEAYIVEIKSHLRLEGVEQLLNMMRTFRTIFPEYSERKVYGLIAAAHLNNDALNASREAGFHLLTFEDDSMRFHDENGFVAKAY